VVSRIRSTSVRMFLRAFNELRSDGIPPSCDPSGWKASTRCFFVNAHFRHYRLPVAKAPGEDKDI
jgi:hypothetical protein